MSLLATKCNFKYPCLNGLLKNIYDMGAGWNGVIVLIK